MNHISCYTVHLALTGAMLIQIASTQAMNQSESRDRINKAVSKVNAKDRRYQPRDIDGKPGNETMCNWFVGDVALTLGYGKSAIPTYDQDYGDRPGVKKPKSANELNKYFAVESAKPNGHWKKINREEAADGANRGDFVVASRSNPGDHGHIAVVIPGSTAAAIRIAQAGRVTGNDLTLKEGFGDSVPQFFRYQGK